MPKKKNLTDRVPVVTLPALTLAQKHQRAFERVLSELAQLHEKKSLDYGSDIDPLANIRASNDFGIEPYVGALLRLNDKVHRLKVYAVRGTLANEGAEDSLKDIVVYGAIALQLFREKIAAESVD